jgi:hypothetical protein
MPISETSLADHSDGPSAMSSPVYRTPLSAGLLGNSPVSSTPSQEHLVPERDVLVVKV